MPEPLHPAIVHFPIVLVILLPIFMLGAFLAIRRGTRPARAWAVPLAAAVALAASSWLAVSTGEAQEDRVEAVVGERVLHEHEEGAERFLVLSGVLMLVAGVGLAPGVLGTSARLIAAVGSLGLVAAGVRVGTTGGDLVYRHGAASAYVDAAGVAGGSPAGAQAAAAGPVHRVAASRADGRVPLPGLLAIMTGLDASMYRIARGLWLENYDTVAVAARQVADHPKVPEAERRAIFGVLGPDAAAFREADLLVHDLAVSLARAAEARAVDEALEANARLETACVACHAAFRDRLREGLAAARSR